MKTLVIHPPDPSTNFLKPIYLGKNFTVQKDYRKFALRKSILEHERIILLGHGSEAGLFDLEKGFCIEEKHAELFKDKELICIWCYASVFFQKKILRFNPKKSFCTGMFISEMLEALLLNVETDEEEIEKSNSDFANIFEKLLDEDDRATILENSYIDDSELRKFNAKRFFEYSKGLVIV